MTKKTKEDNQKRTREKNCICFLSAKEKRRKVVSLSDCFIIIFIIMIIIILIITLLVVVVVVVIIMMMMMMIRVWYFANCISIHAMFSFSKSK